MYTMHRCKKTADHDKPASYNESFSVVQRRERKFAQVWGYLHLGTMIALIKGAYKKKGKGMESLRLRTMRRCKKPNDFDGLASYTESFSVVQCRQWKFAQIRGYLYLGTLIALMKGGYEKKREGMESLKMQSIRWCKKPTDLDGPANYNKSFSFVQRRQRKFA